MHFVLLLESLCFSSPINLFIVRLIKLKIVVLGGLAFLVYLHHVDTTSTHISVLAASSDDRATIYDKTIMKHSLDILSENEWQLYKDTISLSGTMEDLTQQLSENETYDNYREIHQQYLELLITTADDKIKSEALKRLIFLNWYSILEPSCFTGVDNLDNKTIFNSFSILNDYIKDNKLDAEFIWMLSYYSCWDWIILTFSENKLDELTKFVKSVDTSILHIPKNQLPKGSMDNRGQMGIYWTSCSVEKEETK